MNLKITDLLDTYWDENIPMDSMPVPSTKSIKEAAMKKVNGRKNSLRPMRIALIAAAIIILLTGTVLGIMQYTRMTESLEDRWETFGSAEMTTEQKNFIEERSADIGESVTDQGITVTVDSVTCTTNTVYVMIHYVMDPERYDSNTVNSCFDSGAIIYVENEDYGTSDQLSGSGREMPQDVEGHWVQKQFTFDGLPEDANLGDGKTTMHIDMTEITYGFADEIGMKEADGAVHGNWSFAFLLPKSEKAEAKTSDAVLSFDTTLEFENGITLELSEIELNETECSFSVKTDHEEYIFVGGDGDQAMLARAAQPDVPCFTVFARMKDGGMVYGGAGMNWDENTDIDRWTVEWATPVDPQSIDALIFSDGIIEQEVLMTD